MDILKAVKRSQKTGEEFYFYYDDGSRSVYVVSTGRLLLNGYGDFATFTTERFLSKKFTFSDKKAKK